MSILQPLGLVRIFIIGVRQNLIWRQTAPYPICTIDYKGVWFGRSIQADLIKPEYQIYFI